VPSRPRKYPAIQTDVVLFTALAEEAAAVEELIQQSGGRHLAKRNLKGLDYRLFQFGDPGNTITCALVASAGMGRLESAISSTMICMELQPKFVLLIGIAGGFRSKRWNSRSTRMNLGDILVANEILDVDTRRISSRDDIHVRPKVFRVGDFELQIAHAVSESSWLESIPTRLRGEFRPEVHFGSMVSGDVLLASDEVPSISRLYFDVIRQTKRGLIGIEMEGAGVALAVQRCDPVAGFLMVRGVSDYADQSKKRDETSGRELATYSAASFAVTVILSVAFSAYLHQREHK
jgi:nucleoside phosphorylase